MTRRNRKQYGLAFLIISLVGLALVILSGSVFSGYHFMDCHTYAEVQQELMQRSWLEILRDRVHGEFGSRFRPLFYVNVLFKTWLFGSNLALQGFWQLLQNIIAAFLIYALGRNLQFSHKESLLFAGLTLVGTQAAILYQTITVEPAGLIFLMLSWYFIVKYIRSEQHSTAGRICYTCGIVLSSLLAILIKENFILMLPASYVLWCMMYAQKQGANLKNTLLHTRKAGVFFLLLTVAALSAVVILASGGANFGYAGIDYHSGIGAYLKAATYFYTISGSAILAFMGTIYLAYSKKICNSSWIYALAFFAAITAPQIVVHAKSGIIDRYMIPGMVGCAYLAIFVYRELIKNDRTVNEKRWRNISLILGVTGIVVGGLAVFSQSVQQAIVAAAFYIQGQQLQEMTAASSIQYLTSTISTMGVAGMLTGGLLLAWGFRGFSKNADDTKNVCADDMKNVCVNDMKNVCADDMKKVCVCANFVPKQAPKENAVTLSQLYFSGLLLVLILSCGLAFASCQRYAMRGHATEDFLNTVIEYTEPNDIILVVGKPPHEGEGLTLGISTYLKTHNRSNLYVYPLTEKKDAGGLLNFYNSKDIDAIADKDKIQAIAIFSGMEKLFTEKSQAWLTGGYTVYSFNGGYAVYAKALK